MSARRGCVAWICALLVLAFSGCAEAPKATWVGGTPPFEEAVDAATDGLAAQIGTSSLIASTATPRAIVIDSMLDAASGEQTNATQLLQRRVAARLATSGRFKFLPFTVANLATASYLLTGTMTRTSAGQPDGLWRIELALTELKTGRVAAQAGASTDAAGLDHTPLPYYRDSPVALKDKSLEGYARTSATPPGQAADPFYFQRLAAAARIDQAVGDYGAERYAEAAAGYRDALGAPGGEQLRALDGIYLTSLKLDRSADAEQAFGRVVALGIEHDELGVKFLFNPGSTEFWPDPKISGTYPMWLREIAHQAGTAKACMSLIGHTSRTGSEAVNDGLSLQRAAFVRQRLVAADPALAARTKISGVGFRENIVGNGSDDAKDLLDRRVEFRIVACP